MNTVMGIRSVQTLPGRSFLPRVVAASNTSSFLTTSHLNAGDLATCKVGMHAHSTARRLYVQAVHAVPEESTSGAVLHEEEPQHQQAEEAEEEAAGPSDEPAVEGLASKFGGNSQFAAVLQTALKRSGGAQVLQSSSAPSSADNEPPRPTALEEVLLAALRDSRRNILMLEDMLKSMEGAMDREQKQFDRLHFAYKKASSDAAYARTMEKLLQRERAKNSGNASN